MLCVVWCRQAGFLGFSSPKWQVIALWVVLAYSCSHSYSIVDPCPIVRPALYPLMYCPLVMWGSSHGAAKRIGSCTFGVVQVLLRRISRISAQKRSRFPPEWRQWEWIQGHAITRNALWHGVRSPFSIPASQNFSSLHLISRIARNGCHLVVSNFMRFWNGHL